MTDDILIALVGGAVVLVVWYFQHDRQLRRRLASVAVTPIGDVRPGLVRIVGRVSAKGAPLVAPGTGATCVAYSTLVFTPDGDDRTVVTRFHECTPFWLEDPSGRIQVQAGENVRVILASDLLRVGAAEGVLEAMIAAENIEMTSFLGGPRDFRFEEAVVSDGQEVCVLGYASADIDPTRPPEGPRRLPIGPVLRDGGRDRPLVIGGEDATSTRRR